MPWPVPARESNSSVGIYDRDYYRYQRPGTSPYVPRTVVGAIIAANVIVWLLDFLVEGRLSDLMAVHVETISKPWLWWQFLTAGFAHSPLSFEHILFNMLGLFFLGRDVEEAYGPREFLRLYLAMIVFASVVWSAANKFLGAPGWLGAYGASGAIAGVVVLYALNFPRRTLLLFFVFPIPAWLFGVLVVGLDLMGVSGRGESSNVAYSMHLAGAAFALVYYQAGWNFTRLTEGRLSWPSFRRKPPLRLHKPDEESPPDLNAEVDRILEKIGRDGVGSLTAQERKTLENASREYQRRGVGGK